MKSNTKKLLISVAAIAVFFVGPSSAESAGNPIAESNEKASPMTTDLTPPTTPQEMWRRILMLLNTNGGFVSKKNVEDAIGVSFEHTEKDGDKRALGAAYLHTYTQDLPYLGKLHIGMFDDPSRISLSITWGDSAAELPDCQSLQRVSQDLELLGFEGMGRSLMPNRPSNIEFVRTTDLAEVRRRVANAADYSEKQKIGPVINFVFKA